MKLGVVATGALALFAVGCASQSVPYDAPRVGVGGVEAVLGAHVHTNVRREKTDDYNAQDIIIYRVRLEDGRECDQVFVKTKVGSAPDTWHNLTHYKISWLGIRYHESAPYELCLQAEVKGAE